MTLSSTTTKVTYNGDGSTADFAVSFVFWDSDDLRVIHRDAAGVETVWTEGTQYTLTGGNGATGTLTVKMTPTDYRPASGETLTIKDAQPETQGDSFPLSGSFPSTVVEQRVDKLTRLIQIHTEEIARTILLPETASLSGLTIPEPGAGELVRYNAGGTNLETVKLADISTVLNTILTALATDDFLRWDAAQLAWVNITPGATGLALFQDTTAAAARTELGLGTAAVVNTGVASGNVPAMDSTGYPAADGSRLTNVDLPRGYIDGLVLSNNGSDSQHDIDIAAGVARDGGDAANMSLAATLVKRIDGGWTVGTNQGGNDQPQIDGAETVTFTDNGGSDDFVTIDASTFSVTAVSGDTLVVVGGVNAGTYQVTAGTTTQIDVATASFTADANSTSPLYLVRRLTWYHCWLIRRSDTGVVDFIFSESATAPNLPANYDQKRRIGAVASGPDSNIVAFFQNGEEFRWSSNINDVNTNNPGTSRVLYTLSVPSGVKVLSQIAANYSQNPDGVVGRWWIGSPDHDDVSAATVWTLNSGGSGQNTGTVAMIRTNDSAQIAFRSENSSTGRTLDIWTRGWIDPRGRNT